MKRIYPLIFIILFSLSCSDPHRFEIVGSLNSSDYDGSWVYLVPLNMSGRDTHIGVDSTKIEDGKFTFVGTSETMASLRMPYWHRRHIQELLVVTEPGTINVLLDSISSGKGTPQNEALQQWKDHLMQWHEAYAPLVARRVGTTGADSLWIESQIDSLIDIDREFTYEFVKRWRDATVGKFVGTTMRSVLTDEQKAILFSDSIN